MLFAIDIDGTIAGASKIFGAYFNQELELGLPPEEAQKIRWYTSLRKHPAIVAYRQEHNARFLEVWARYREYAPAMLARDALAGAVEGVTALATQGDIRYVTIRISQDEQVNAQIQATTRQWLSEHHFPHPTNVLFCATFQDKLQHVAREPYDQIVLIDDRCSTDLLTCYEGLVQSSEHQELVERLRQHVTFVAFSKDELPENTWGLRMVTLPSWSGYSAFLSPDPFAEQAARARYNLVQTLKQQGALQRPAVEAAFLSIPRHLFLDTFYRRAGNAPLRWKQITSSAPNWAELVYENEPCITLVNDSGHPISSSSAPEIMAKELEVAAIDLGMRVLEIGAGTGYNAALISHLVGDPKLVTTVELDATLAQLAQQHLDRVIGLGVQVITGDGYQGYAPNAPYDCILATASTQQVPLAWIDQLRDGGTIVLHLQGYLGSGVLVHFQKTGPGRKGEGQIMMGSDFMELRSSTTPSLVTHQLLSQFLRDSVTAEIPFTDAVFEPAVLWDVNLAFLLQIVFPAMRLTSISKTAEEAPQMCLLDTYTHTLLTFRPLRAQQWSVEVRGDPQLWERVLTVYHQWLTLQRPAATAYHLVIDTQGKQMLTLPPFSDQVPAHEWALEEDVSPVS